MVQKKAPDKHDAPAEAKKTHAKSDKRLYSHHHHHQDNRGGAGAGSGDLRKMLKKSRSIKVLEESLESPLGDQLVQLGKPASAKKKKKRQSVAAEPNYMKSTSSSNARKEQVAAQVISNAPPSKAAAAAAANKNHHRIAGNSSKASGHPKSSSPGDASSPKPSKLLARKSSLRPMRSAMKKSSGSPLCPTINASRATCSSTMKETSFPAHLDLSPCGTDATGTSVLRVCPYTYCSLNGHRHAPLPPLRCFLSARRRMLKTQKSMRLMKGLLSFGRTGPPEEADGLETGAGGAELPGFPSVADDLGDGFFLEIYAKLRDDTSPSPSIGSDDVPLVLNPERAAVGTPSVAAGDDNGRSVVDASGTEITWDDDSFDRSSDFSPSEMEVLIDFLEYVECDADDPPCPTTHEEEDDDDDANYCFPTDAAGVIGDDWIYEPVPDAAELDWGEQDDLYIDFDEIDSSELAEGESCDGRFLEINAQGCDEAPAEAISALPDEEDDEGIVAEPEGHESSKSVEMVLDEGFGLGDEGGDASEEVHTSSTSAADQKGMLEEEEEEEEEAAAGQEAEDHMVKSDMGTRCDPFFGDDMDMEEDVDAEDEEIEMFPEIPPSQSDSMAPPATEGTESDDDEMERGIPNGEIEEENKEKVETDQDEARGPETGMWVSEKGDEPQMFDEMSVEDGVEFGASKVCADDTSVSRLECDGGGITSGITSLEKEPADGSNDPRARAVITRKKACTDEEELSTFNPQPPNFLPIELDPESEKVDLRHQLMDERKNSEEWMIDYALRRTVDKLAPGRNRKVALLVEAFETVTPMPRYGSSTLRHSAVEFAHARPIQACS